MIAGSVAGVALIGGGAWAAMAFLSTGAQPAEALPAGTIGYVGVDLDPNGGQKIAALETLKKFPGLDEQLDLGADDDIRKWLFEKIQADSSCEGLDYDQDIEPWLGHRAGAAAVDLGGEEPATAIVLQTDDEEATEAALTTCAADGDSGWAFSDGWVVLADSTEVAEEIVAATADGDLASDSDFQHWTGEAGDPGIATVYAAPAASKYFEDLGGMGQGLGLLGESPVSDESTADPADSFQGFAGTLRFADGGVEIEVASGLEGAAEESLSSGRAGDMVATLPESTSVALGVGLADGWVDQVLDSLAESTGMSADELLTQAEAATGLDLPDDAEALLGESAALALDGDIDPEALSGATDPSALPIGLKVEGDPAEIEGVLDKVRPQIDPTGSVLGSSGEGDVVAIGPDPDYLAMLLEDGGLGDTDAYRDVIPDQGDATGLLYVNFDAADGWLTDVLESGGAPAEVIANVEPLDALGASSWADGDVTHGLLRLTTD
ncbi:DUF3352 domain-containing protein [Nocardioides insulae]|uniref:DUF3352 domain-containing protein n=1 Tax=Nocardioides insulae TaxID=394734 RepID=UPI0004201762|nr:DUF3352 domain-containing protein [Nocardioides insulae]